MAIRVILLCLLCAPVWAQVQPYPQGSVTSVGTGSGLSGGPITSSGTISLNGSSVRYSAGTSVSPAISYTDNGNVVAECGTGAWTAVLPAIQVTGTANAITPGGFQQILDNPTTAQSIPCVGAGSVTATTSTINGSSSAVSIPLGSAGFIFADNSAAPPGNYILVLIGSGTGSGGGATLSANTFTGNQTLQYAGPLIYLDDTGSGTNGGWWSIGSATTTGNFTIASVNDAFSQNHNVLVASRLTDSSAALGTVTVGNTTDNPTVQTPGGLKTSGWSISNSYGSFTAPGSGAYCATGGTSVLVCGTAGTPAYGVDANQNFDTYGSRIALGTVPTLTPTSNCTSFSAVTGGASAFSWTQTSATTGVCAFTVTWSAAQAAPNGWACNGSEASEGTTLFQTNTANHALFVTMKTGATTASGDLYVLHCDAF